MTKVFLAAWSTQSGGVLAIYETFGRGYDVVIMGIIVSRLFGNTAKPSRKTRIFVFSFPKKRQILRNFEGFCGKKKSLFCEKFELLYQKGGFIDLGYIVTSIPDKRFFRFNFPEPKFG